MSSSFTFPTIYGTEKNGKTRMWNALVECVADGSAVATITYGQVDGKQQTTTRIYTTGKNKGKSNETSPFEQGKLETERKWKDKVEKENYSEVFEIVESSVPTDKIFPMLAGTYSIESTKKNDIVYPCLVQPKLDGLRCIMYQRDGQVLAQSRTGTIFSTLSYVTDSLTSLFNTNPTLVLDGELYTMNIPFETLAGLLKKKHITAEDRDKLEQNVQYHVYDMISPETFIQRILRLQHMSFSKYVIIVNTEEVLSISDFQCCFSSYVAQGYEGIMLRNKHGLYKSGFRSNDLQKYKEFLEDEYKIVGFEEGDGRDKGCVIWVCATNARLFRVRPRGSMPQRREWFQNGAAYVNKKLTVIFQELSEQGIPRFPVGKAIREDY